MQQNKLEQAAKHWKAFALALVAIGVLSGCNGSGSSSGGGDGVDNGASNGDDSGDTGNNGSDDGDGDGNGGSDAGIGDADRVLLYHATDMIAGEFTLFAVDADNPQARAEVSPAPQYNRAARDVPNVAWQGQTFTAPDDSNLPLGVLGGDFIDGELSNASYQYTVFNTNAGELYRLDAGNGDTTAVRFSSENNASVICAAFVAPDLADIDNSRLVYQVAKDNSCADTEIRMARIGDDENGEVVSLHENVEWELSFQDLQPPFFAELGGWVASSDGGLVEILSFDGDEIRAYNLDNQTNATLESDSNHFAVLGYTDDGETLVYAGDGGVVKVYVPGETPETLSFPGVTDWSVSFDTDQTRAVEANGILYVVDATGNRVVRIDGTDANQFYNPGGTNFQNARAMTYANDTIAFAYGSTSGWNVYSISLTSATSNILVSGVNASFPVTSPSAPGGNGSYWFLYNDFGGPEDDPVARGIEFTSGGGIFDMGNDTLWRGETWSTTLGEPGVQAEYLFYQESGQQGALFSLDASDPANSSRQDMGVQDLTWDIWISGFGPVTLMAGREGQVLQTNRVEVLYVNAAEANSAVRLTDEMIDHRSIPFY